MEALQWKREIRLSGPPRQTSKFFIMGWPKVKTVSLQRIAVQTDFSLTRWTSRSASLLITRETRVRWAIMYLRVLWWWSNQTNWDRTKTFERPISVLVIIVISRDRPTKQIWMVCRSLYRPKKVDRSSKLVCLKPSFVSETQRKTQGWAKQKRSTRLKIEQLYKVKALMPLETV